MQRSSALAGVILIALGALIPASSAAAADGDFFPSDDGTLAIFEFSGTVSDSSGNGRNATLIDPASTFTPSVHGTGLVLPGVGTGGLQGIDWTPYANKLVPPYTIEAIIYPENLDSWNRLFTHDAASDNGLYYYNGAIQNYPDDALTGDPLPAQSAHCIAWTAPVEPANVLDVYLDGEYLGQVGRPYDQPSLAWFFMDNTAGGGTGENLDGYVDAMRISSVARTPVELAATCAAADAGVSLIPAADPVLPETGSDRSGLQVTSLFAAALMLGGAATLVAATRRRRSAH